MLPQYRRTLDFQSTTGETGDEVSVGPEFDPARIRDRGFPDTWQRRDRTAGLRAVNPTQALPFTGNAEEVPHDRQRDDDLSEVVAACDSLPPAMGAGVVAIMRAARGR